MLSEPDLKPLIVIGGGGHASVLIDILRVQKREILAVICPDDLSQRSVFNGILHLSKDEDVLNYPPDSVRLVNGIGVLPRSNVKKKLNQYYLSLGYQFETVISEQAWISNEAVIETGAQVFAGAIIQTGAKISAHTIINSKALIEHDSVIGKYNHVAPNATICGQVETSENVYVGASSTLIQNIKLDKNVVVGAGAVVTKNVLEGRTCYPYRTKTQCNGIGKRQE